MSVMSIPHQNVIHCVVNISLIILWIIFVKHYSSKISTAELYNSLRSEAKTNNETMLPQINVSERYGNDSFCNKSACVRKCCPEGQSLMHSDGDEVISCVKTNKTLKFIELPLSDSENKEELLKNNTFGFVFGFPCQNILYRKRPKKSYNITSIGKLIDHEGREYKNKRHCIDKLIKNNVTSIEAFTCNPEFDIYGRFFLYLSLACLLITFMVCVIVPELRNTTFGLCLMSHTASLFLAYLTIALSLFGSNYFQAVIYEYQHDDGWYIHAYHVQVRILRYLYFIFYYAGFFWLNVICFDIWRTLRKMTPTNSGANQNRFIEGKRFLIYSLLSWFTPILFFIIHASLYGKHSVRFQDCYCIRKYFKECALFLGPLGISVLVNIIFFGHTLYVIKRTWRQASPAHASRMQNQKNKKYDYERLSVCVKLFIIMGIPYILELSYFVFASYLKDEFWYLPDITRSLQGLLILQLFVLNKRKIKLLYHKYSPVHCSTISEFFTSSGND